MHQAEQEWRQQGGFILAESIGGASTEFLVDFLERGCPIQPQALLADGPRLPQAFWQHLTTPSLDT